jgi:hypothetical protein
VTADTASPGASIQIAVGSTKCAALSGANVTDHALSGCGNLKVGTKVVLGKRSLLSYFFVLKDDRFTEGSLLRET